VADGFTIPRNDDVALVHSRFGSWSFGFDVHDHYTSSAALDRDKLETEAKIAPRYVAVLLKPRRNTLNSGRRDNEHSPVRPEHRHADRPTRRINCETAFRTLPYAQIKFDPSVDLTAAQ
jgi:hypothetical protein